MFFLFFLFNDYCDAVKINYNNSYKLLFCCVFMADGLEKHWKLQDLEVLEALGEVSQRHRRGVGKHTVAINVKSDKKDVALVEATKFISDQKGIAVDSFDYRKDVITIRYTHTEEATSKPRSPGCGPSDGSYFGRD
jgi:hypothetical protein